MHLFSPLLPPPLQVPNHENWRIPLHLRRHNHQHNRHTNTRNLCQWPPQRSPCRNSHRLVPDHCSRTSNQNHYRQETRPHRHRSLQPPTLRIPLLPSRHERRIDQGPNHIRQPPRTLRLGPLQQPQRSRR